MLYSGQNLWDKEREEVVRYLGVAMYQDKDTGEVEVVRGGMLAQDGSVHEYEKAIHRPIENKHGDIVVGSGPIGGHFQVIDIERARENGDLDEFLPDQSIAVDSENYIAHKLPPQ